MEEQKQDTIMIPKSPVSYKEFAKNPLVALLFMVTLALGVLYYQGRSSEESNIQRERDMNDTLRNDLKRSNEKLIEFLTTKK